MQQLEGVSITKLISCRSQFTIQVTIVQKERFDIHGIPIIKFQTKVLAVTKEILPSSFYY